MTTYRLPDVLGGGEVTPDGTFASGWPVVNVPGLGKIALHRDHLIEVKPPQPEPGYYLATDDSDGAIVVAERDGEDWYLTGQIGSVPWGAVWDNYSTFTRLIPAPEPVELPWKGQSLYGAGLTIRLGEADPVNIIVSGNILAAMEPAVAREMARALNTAADKAEAEATS